MAESQAGVTALVTAYARAYHATHDSPKIFDDFLADAFYTPEEHIQFNANLADMLKLVDPELAATHPSPADALAAVMQIHNEPVTLSRSRYTEDCLDEAVRQGVEQYVILGAGLDTFAFRRPELAGKLQIFEVDHPVTQEMKHQRIGMAGWEIPAHLHFVPIDFTSESLATALGRSSYDPGRPTFFSWQGVSYYLAQDVIRTTLSALAGLAPQGSPLVFDYLGTEAFDPQKNGKRVQFMLWITQQVGEPIKSGLDPLGLAGELAPLGLRLVENLSPQEIERRYFQGRSDRLHALEHMYFARAVVGGRFS